MGRIDTFPEAQTPAPNMPVTLAYTDTTTALTGIAATETTIVSTTFTVPAGRRLKVTALVNVIQNGATGLVIARFKEGTTELGRFGRHEMPAGWDNTLTGSMVITPSAGAHTYSVTLNTNAGTLDTSTFAAPSYILVEDITGLPAPVAATSVPVGLLGYAELIADQSGISTNALLSALSVNVAVPAGRTLRINTYFDVHSTVDGAVPVVEILQDDVVIARSTLEIGDATNRSFTMLGSVLESPPAGAHTYAVRLVNALGGGSLTVTAAANRPGYISVEDITPTPTPANSAPSSTLAYAPVTTSQGSITGTSTTLDGHTVTVTIPAGRRLRITAGNIHILSTVANDAYELRLYEDGALIDRATDRMPVASNAVEVSIPFVLTPSAGTHTYELRLHRSAGTGTLSTFAATNRIAYTLVEDITPASIQPSAIVPGAIVANSSARPSSPAVGTEIYEPDTGLMKVWNGSNWVTETNLKMHGVGAAKTGGAAPAIDTGSIPFKIQTGTNVLTTTASGHAAINFPVAFPNGVFTVQANNGDVGAWGFNVAGTVSVSTTGVTLLCIEYSGAAAASRTVRIDWIAIGW